MKSNLLLCLFICVLAPDAPAQENVVLQLNWHNQFQFAGYYAAQRMGFYRDEGLHVTIREGEKQELPILSVLGGSAEYGVSDAHLLAARMEGKPVVVLAAIFQHSPHILMTVASKGLATPSDLIGKKVALSDWIGVAQLKALFLNEGIPLSSLNRVTGRWNLDDLISGKVDALSAYSTHQPFMLEQRGIEPAIIKPEDYGIDFYGDCLFTSEKEIDEHASRAAAFRRASLRGWEYAMSHVDELIDVIYTADSLAHHSRTREALRYEARRMQELIYPGVIEIGHMNIGRWERMARTFVELGLEPKEYSLDGFMYETNPVREERWLRIVLLSLGGGLLLSGAAFVWVFLLRRTVRHRTGELQKEVEQRRRAEIVLQESEEKYRRLVEFSPDAIILVQNGTCVFANATSLQLFGCNAPQALVGRELLEVVMDESRTEVQDALRKTEGAPLSSLLEATFRRCDGTRMLTEVALIPVQYRGAPAMQVVVRDITERKETSSLLVASLKEKDVLLKEVHHRVKNNMQVISSLLSLQIAHVSDPATREMFAESRHRIKSMALVHEKLYQSENLASINFKDYVDKLAVDLFRSYARPGISFAADIDNVSLSVDAAIPCGLIINELVSNSLKHAFPEGREGNVRVLLRRGDENTIFMNVADNGVGMPPALVIEEVQSLGMQLVLSLVHQLGGVLEINREAGTDFAITFPFEE